MTAESSEVLALGAGIVGSSTAYHLAEAGAPVTLVERSHPAVGDAVTRLAMGAGQPTLAPFSPTRFAA